MDNALRNIANIFDGAFEVIEPHLKSALASAADPERSLIYFERLIASRDETLLHDLSKKPRVIESLVTIVSGSQFLTEILLRNPKNVHLLVHRKSLTQRKHAEQVHAEAAQVIHGGEADDRLNALRRYQRGEILRI